MVQRIARLALRWRWAVIAVWLAVAVAANVWLPDLSGVVAHNNTLALPHTASVVVAENLEQRIDPSHAAATTAVLTIHDGPGLSTADRAYFRAALQRIAGGKPRYNVSSLTDVANVPASARGLLQSRDGTTQLAVVGFKSGDTSDATGNGVVALRQALSGAPRGAQSYVTGAAAIQHDSITVTQDGVRKTEGVTIALVLIILLVVFRTPIAPLIPLLVIGLCYLTTARLVAWLGLHGLPVSSFTQTFLIAVLFGAGTDYCLLLMSRFREELSRPGHRDRAAALDATFGAAGPTVLFSGLTVLISFATLIFAGFGLYRSGVGVATGLLVTLAACLTLIPALLGVLGPALFWPRRPQPGTAHPESRLWGWASRVATARPWLTVGAVLLVVVPVAVLFRDQRSFNPLAEIAPSTPSVAGFNVVSAAFNPGRVLPMSLVIDTSANLRTSRGLAAIDNVSRVVAAQPHVREVDSATQPTGQPISSFQLASQNGQAAHEVAGLQAGAGQLAASLDHTAAAVQRLQRGARQLDGGLARLNGGSAQVQGSAARLSTSATQLSQAAGGIYSGTVSLASSATTLSTALQYTPQAGPAAAQLAAGTGTLAQQNGRLAAGMQQLAAGSAALARGAAGLHQGIGQAARGAHQLDAALGPLYKALRQEAHGAHTLASNLGALQRYLQQSGTATSEGSPGFYIPASVVAHNADLRRALDTYISPDGHVARLTVVLNVNPYSQQAIDAVPQLENAAQVALRTAHGIRGVVRAADTTPDQAALSIVSQGDFVRTAILVLLTVYVLLAILLRSLVTPFYVILSLGGTYLVTMSLLQGVFVGVLHKEGLSWTVPFFVFFLLVALGVDYSIFLMSRFDEEYRAGRGPVDAIRRAAAGMGGVIFSAAVIMAGTFGSLATSGITSLLEIGVAVIVGLLLYTVVMLALFVPACAAIAGHGHRWPWREEAGHAEPGHEPARLSA